MSARCGEDLAATEWSSLRECGMIFGGHIVKGVRGQNRDF